MRTGALVVRGRGLHGPEVHRSSRRRHRQRAVNELGRDLVVPGGRVHDDVEHRRPAGPRGEERTAGQAPVSPREERATVDGGRSFAGHGTQLGLGEWWMAACRPGARDQCGEGRLVGRAQRAEVEIGDGQCFHAGQGNPVP